jgi:chloride channel protein, CIC family
LKYRSMYEAQVPGRAQSPAHYAEYVQLGLDLLETRQVQQSARLAHLDVMSLLSSGVSVDLPGGREIRACQVAAGSHYIGQQVQKFSSEAGEEAVDIVAILRGGEVLLPNPALAFQSGDRVLAIVSPQGRDWLDRHCAPLNPASR